jgi:hypothetical protein
MMLSLLLAAVVAVPSASPAPMATGYGSLPVIINVHTSAVCTTLRQTVVPVGYIAKTNDAAFADVKKRTLKVAMSQISDDKDFEMLARRDQSDVDAVLSNSELALKLLDQSRKRFPGRENPEIEAMRAELLDVIELQKKYSSVVDAISGAYLDSLSNRRLYGGFYGDNTSSVQQRDLIAKRDFINSNRVLLGLTPFDSQPIAGSDQADQQALPMHDDANPFTQPQPDASPGSRQQTGAPQLGRQLSQAEYRLQTTAVAALKLCNHANR